MRKKAHERILIGALGARARLACGPVSFTLNTDAKAIRQVKVDAFPEQADKDRVALQVDFQTLPDGKNDAAGRNLNVAAGKIVVNITAANYRKLAQ